MPGIFAAEKHRSFRFYTAQLRLIASVATALLFVCGCSNSTPEIIAAQGTVVFEYVNEDTAPQMRLAVFAETGSDVRRVSHIRAVNRENNYEWTAVQPLIIGSNDRQWSGYTDFVSPAGQSIPSGEYDLFYTDAEDRTMQTTFSVSYPDRLITAKAADAPDLLGAGRQELIAASLNDGTLIYYGPRKAEWKTDEDIWNELTLAKTIRVCWTNSSRTVVCMMIPAERAENTVPAAQ